MDKYLESFGLNPEKFSHLLAEFGITTVGLLKEYSGDEELCDKLTKDLEHEEKEAVKKLLSIEGDEDDSECSIDNSDDDENIDHCKQSLKAALEEKGLKSTYWMEIFKKHLGITSLAALKFVSSNDFTKVEKYADQDWKIAALKDLMDIDTDSANEKQRKKDCKKALERHKDAKNIIAQLNELKSQGKALKDDGIAAKVNKIRKALEIPDEAWILHDAENNLSNVINTLEKLAQQHDIDLVEHEQRTELEVLQSASGGLALKGLLLSHDCEDQDFLQVLSSPADVKFRGPALSQKFQLKSFTTKRQKSQFLKLLENYGYSVAASVSGGYGGLSAEFGGSYSNENENSEESLQSSSEVYYSQVKYAIVPMASFTFDVDNVKLSEQCINALKSLEKVVMATTLKSIKQKECEKFFRKFGSHVNIGPIHFGGIYYWKSEYQSQTHTDKRIVKKLSQEAIGAFVNVSYLGIAGVGVEGNASSLKGKFSGNYENSDLQSTSLLVEAKGGPPEAGTFPHWKNGLVISNSNWAVIDRGHNFTPIWQLLSAHKSSFRKVSELESILCCAWQTLTGMQENHYLARKELLEIQQELEDVLTSAQKFSHDKDFAKNCSNYLQTIVQVRIKAINETLNPALWLKTIKDRSEIVDLLKVVLQHKKEYDRTDVSAIKCYLKQILEDTEEWHFNEKKNLLIWAQSGPSVMADDNTYHSTTDVLTFIERINSYIKPKLEKVEMDYLPDEEKDQLVIGATAGLAFMAKEVLKKNKNKQVHNFMKLMLLPLNYNIKSGYFTRHLSLTSLKHFLRQLDEKYTLFTDYLAKGEKELEAFIVEMILESIAEENDPVHKESKFLDLIKSVELSADCKELVEKACKPVINWNTLQRGINSRKDGLSQEPTTTTIDGLFRGDLEPEVNDEEQVADPVPLNFDPRKKQLLDKLGLTQYYPNKITLQQVRETQKDKVVSLSDVPWFLLTKIMLLDFRGRNNLQLPGSSENVNTEHSSGKGDNKASSNQQYVQQLLSNLKKKDNSRQEKINPMDVVCALYLCSSSFLKQLLSQKLFMCRVSVPFLVPDVNETSVLQVWSLRDIILACNGVQQAALKSKTLIVSVSRIGELPRSKSQLLNELLSVQSHGTFFHHDFKNGNTKTVLSQGMIDAAWYIQSENSISEKQESNGHCFKQTSLFLNLHGDATDFHVQRRFACGISNLSMVFVDFDDVHKQCTIDTLTSIAELSTRVLLIILKKQGVVKESLDGIGALLTGVGHETKFDLLLDFDVETNKRTNLDLFKSEIIGEINTSVQDCDKSVLLDLIGKCSDGKTIIFDEDTTLCQHGKVTAKNIYEKIKEFEIRKAKMKLLPLQGKLWKEWGVLKKKENRLSQMQGNHSREHYAMDLYQKSQELRRRQFRVCTKLSDVMTSFISNLLRLPGEARFYFIHWLRLYLDELSRLKLPKYEQEYSETWSKLQRVKKDKRNAPDDYINSLKGTLRFLEQQLEESSFGWEHLLREMGQIYEAVTEFKAEVVGEVIENVKKLPKVMAQLMVAGYPMEIMDGNAAHVPLNWTQAVFNEVQNIIKDKKIFVLSVLGIQSSGKSTLLNTMFGLQFAVRAGRCTQGVFAQLVPVPTHLEKLGYDYLMVVDTEGLRAPELGFEKHQHDNELATLAIGIADLTILNIKGENQSEIQDVLQIVVHAFVRMKIVNKNLEKLNCSCFFIHQNVGANDADRNMQRGRSNLMARLDEMARMAALAENASNINSFSDVINFDGEKNVRNFTNLWQGEPPMAPVNPGYSDKVREVKKFIYDEILPTVGSHSTIKHISLRIGDLWKGILADDFVFSFRNSLEIKAYNSLEVTFNNLSWQLQDQELKWFNDTALNIIKGAEGNRLQDVRPQLELTLRNRMGKSVENAQRDLQELFTNSEDKEILEQWRDNTFRKLKMLSEDIVRSVLKLINDELGVRQLELTQSIKFKKWNEDISAATVNLATQLQARELTKEEISSEFDKLWIEMLTKQPPRDSVDLSANVLADVQSSLSASLKDHNDLLKKELSTTKLTDPIGQLLPFIIGTEHFSVETRYLKKKAESAVCKELANKQIKDLFKDIEDYLNGIKHQNFNRAHADKLTQKIINFVDTCNKMKNRAYNFTRSFKVAVMIHVCRYALPKFQDMHECYKKKADPTVQEEIFKKQLFIKFQNIYKQSVQEKIVADLLCDVLENLISVKIEFDLPRELACDVRNHHDFMGSAGMFKAQTLKELMEIGSFGEYEAYIDSFSVFVQKHLTRYTLKHLFCDNTSRYAVVAKIKLDLIYTSAMKVIHDIPISENCTFKDWIAAFINDMGRLLPVTKEKMQEVENTHIDKFDFKNFNSTLTANLSASQEALNAKYGGTKSLDKSSLDLIVEQLAQYCHGCGEQCPFCGAPCTLTSRDHTGMDHIASQHHPQGVHGISWQGNNKLVVDTCTSLVGTGKRFKTYGSNYKWTQYNEYKTIYPNWSIPADTSIDSSLYWRWFMYHFSSSLAKKYNCEEGDVQDWASITDEKAKESLSLNI